MENQLLRPWKTLSRRIVLEHSKFLSIESHTIQLPDGEVISDWPSVMIPDAAIVSAVTRDQRFICFRQIKYAVEGISLAPVGGMIEPDEIPLAAAQRELLEETGYESSEWINLGKFAVDPNRGVAQMHLFLALNAEQIQDPDSDDLEDQELIYLSRTEIGAALLDGEFKVLAWTAVIAMALNYLDRSTRN